MKAYLETFFKEFDYADDDPAHLLASYRIIDESKDASELFKKIIDGYTENTELDYKAEVLDKACLISELTGIHTYTCELLAFICMSKHLRALYREKGISQDVYHRSMLDLKYKLEECKLVKGIKGSFVASWFPGFFKLKRFAMGRLQFEIVTYNGDDYERAGKRLRFGDKVINVHIPRSGEPLTKESTDSAYAEAKEFFKNEINGDVAFVCHSWLLYKPALEVFPRHTNTYRFVHEFDVVRSDDGREGAYSDAWRLFDMDYTGRVDDYPENTSMRRAYKKYLLDGGKMGQGYGIIFA